MGSRPSRSRGARTGLGSAGRRCPAGLRGSGMGHARMRRAGCWRWRHARRCHGRGRARVGLLARCGAGRLERLHGHRLDHPLTSERSASKLRGKYLYAKPAVTTSAAETHVKRPRLIRARALAGMPGRVQPCGQLCLYLAFSVQNGNALFWTSTSCSWISSFSSSPLLARYSV
jgi:hypothetical protein